MNQAISQASKAITDDMLVRAHLFGRGSKGGAIDIMAIREGRRVVVRWNVNRGDRWLNKGWKATFRSEADALTFVEKKWETLCSWLVTLERVAPIPAAAYL